MAYRLNIVRVSDASLRFSAFGNDTHLQAGADVIEARISRMDPYRSSKIRERIRSFQDLPAGWHYGDGVMIPDHVRDGALKINEMFVRHCAEDIEAFPCADGGILVSGYRGKWTVDVLCRPCGMFDISLEENGILQEDRTDQNLGDLETFLKGLKWQKSFAYSTRNYSVSTKVDLKVPRSGSPLTEATPSSIKTVLTVKADPSASTLRGNIKTSPDIPPFYGTSMSMHSPPNAISRMSHQRAGISVTETSAA